MRCTYEFEATGTHWNLQLEYGDQNLEAIQERIAARIATFEQAYSRFRPDSLISQIAQRAGTYTLPEDAKVLFDLYQKAYGATDGLVTPLIGQVLIDAGYDAGYSLQPKALSTPPAWDAVMRYDFPILQTMQPVQLDLGAAGKGYLVDILADQLRSEGITVFTINAGGDIYTQGEVITVGLEHPDNPEQVIGTVTGSDLSICGSSGNRRRWAQYHHLINAHTLISPDRIQAVWAIASTALVADMLTTCLFFERGEQLAVEYKAEWVVLYDDYSVRTSPNFSGTLFTESVA